MLASAWHCNMCTKTLDIDDCTATTCNNGGTCVDLVAAYRCDCVLGFTGTNCETGMVALAARAVTAAYRRYLGICYIVLNYGASLNVQLINEVTT